MMVGDEWAIWPSWVVPRESPPVPSLDGSFVYRDESREKRVENRKSKLFYSERTDLDFLLTTLSFCMEVTCLNN
jgi:hypothetical protein